MKVRIICITLLLINGITILAKKRGETLWCGGSISLFMPTNLLKGENTLGFNDVSSMGIGIKGNFDWYFQPNLVIGGEIGYSHSKIDQEFWDMNKYGEAKGGYTTIPMMINSQIIFDHKGDVRPFVGVAFGGDLLLNDFDFQSSYNNNAEYPDFTYTTSNFKPAVAAEVGVQFMLSSNSLLSLSGRFNYISDLESTTTIIYDQDGYEIGSYVQNPHGRQNFFELMVGLRFGVNNK